MKVALFITCFNDTLFPDAGRATVELLERLGHEVVFVYAGRLAEGDVVPPEGGWYDDDGLPMWVEWRPVGAPLEGDGDTLPLYPDGLGAVLPVR